MPCNDLNSTQQVKHPAPKTFLGVENVHRQNHLLSTAGISSTQGISSLCRSVPGQLQDQRIQVSRPLPVHGICPAYLQGKPQGYRSMPAIPKEKTLPYGYQGSGFPKHLGQCQQNSRLANICRSGSASYLNSHQALQRRGTRSGTGKYSLCSGFNNHRSVSVHLSMGQFQKNQRSNQTSYPAGFTWRYSNVHPYFRSKNSRYQGSRHIAGPGWSILHHGPWISKLQASICHVKAVSFFCNSSQVKPEMSQNLFPQGGAHNRTYLRPVNKSDRILSVPRLSGKNAQSQISKSGRWQHICFSDEQFFFASTDYLGIIPKSLENRDLLQMDKAKSSNQSILWDHRKCGQEPNMDCHLGLRFNSNHEKRSQNRN